MTLTIGSRRALLSPGSGDGAPTPPPGYVLLKGEDGQYLLGADGAYLYGAA